MANVIKIKRSTVPGKVPVAGDLEVGELAVNTADGALYTKHNDNSVKQISANLATVTLDYAVTNGNTTARPITFSNTTSSTSTTTGALVVTGGVGIGGNLNVGSTIYVTGDILPTGNNTSNIGSATNRFHTLFVSSNSLDIGGEVINATGQGELRFATKVGNLTFTGNLITYLNNLEANGLGATYSISAETPAADSGALLTLTGSNNTSDSIRFAAGQNIDIVQTDANTITISSTLTGSENASRNIINGNVTLGSDITLVDSVLASGNTSIRWNLISSDPVAGNNKFCTIDSINDGSAVYYNEYAVLLSSQENEVAVFTSNILAGNVNLYALGERSGIAVTFQRLMLGSYTTSGPASIENLATQRGYTGSRGAVGYSGSAGTGYTGSAGTGYTGSAGTGYTGSAGTGYTGSRGATGYTGSAPDSIIGFYGSAGGGAIGGNLFVPGTTSVSGNIIPTANVTYSLGSNERRFKDLYLAGNTIFLGNTVFSTEDVLPFNLNIAPEVLTIQVDATEPGDDVRWFWTWETSTLPYARTQITNSPQISVPLYRQGTYTVNNFAANELHGNLTQVHKGYFKWIEGAGTQNLISWAVDQGNVSVSHPSINGGAVTSVQRILVTVPSTITVPTLTTHTANYTVSFANVGKYTFTGDSEADNPTLGPMYRGGTYTFTLDSSLANHPFYLTTDNGTGFVANAYVGEYTTGVTGTRGNGQPGFSTLTFVVPNNAPSTLYYQCGVHSSMRGAIRIKDLAVDVNANGNYVVYFQHTHEGHSTPIELRPIPSLVNQMCLVYDATVGQFVPQDMATYVENTPSFKNKIQEVAGTATLIAPDGIPVVPTVTIVEDVSYLPFVDNKDGDISYTEDTKTLYVWDNNTWNSTKAEGGVGYTGSAGIGYTGSASTVVGFTGSQGAVGFTGSAGAGGGGAQTKTVDYSGTLAVFNGTKRWWINTTFTITKLLAFLITAPTGANLNIRVNKNGSSAATFSVTAGSSSAESVVSISVVKGDYITVDITQVGSTVAGADLTVIFEYS